MVAGKNTFAHNSEMLHLHPKNKNDKLKDNLMYSEYMHAFVIQLREYMHIAQFKIIVITPFTNTVSFLEIFCRVLCSIQQINDDILM
jgi:hypothetical protein